MTISFGTDGWRAVIADGFTFDNVRRVSEAIAVAAGGSSRRPASTAASSRAWACVPHRAELPMCSRLAGMKRSL